MTRSLPQEFLPALIEQPTSAVIERAADLLSSGNLVAFPTETVYGLGADATNEMAIAKIFTAKGRPADHPVIVHLAEAAALNDWARDIPPVAWQLAEAFWPGPLTLILKRHPQASLLLTGGQDTIGLRMPAHPVSLELLMALQERSRVKTGNKGLVPRVGLAAPSANRFGHISPTQALHVAEDLRDQVALILDGGSCPVGIESTILALHDERPRILRPGALPEKDLQSVLGSRLSPMAKEMGVLEKTRVSGLLASHYAPRKPTYLLDSEQLLIGMAKGRKSSYAVLARYPSPQSFPGVWLQMPDTPEAYARNLYAVLRQLDAMPQVEKIYIEALPEDQVWCAIRDRLQRATAREPKL